MPKLLLRVLSAVAFLTAAAAAWFFLAPPQLGGGTSYAIIYGSSMEPHFHHGDLVVLRKRSSPHVGEVVGYHSEQLRREVLHRIVAVQEDRFTFKGDNNSFIDSERPRAGQLFGEEWLKIPGAGAQLGRLRTPRNAAILAGLAAVLLLTGRGTTARRRRRGRPHSEAPSELGPRPEARPPVAAFVVAVGVVALAGSFAFGLVAFTRPVDRTRVWSDLYVQKGRFDYTAKVPLGPVYQQRTLHAPDPVFLRLVHRLDVRFSYSTTTKAPAQLLGLGRLDAVLSDGNGWRHRLILQPARSFTDGHAQVQGSLDLEVLSRLLRRFEAQTGEHNTLYKLELIPFVRLRGTVAGRPVRDTFAPALTLDVDELRLQLEQPSTGSSTLNTLTRAKGGTGTRTEPLTVGAFGRHVTVVAARRYTRLAAAGSAAILLLGALLFLLARRGDEVVEIRRRYGDWIVDVAPGDRPAGVERRVASMDVLARIAERYERLILHERRDGSDAFVVEDDGIVYVYDRREQPPQAEVFPLGWPLPVHVHAVADVEK